MSPRQLLASHTSRELTEWQAYFRAAEFEATRKGPPRAEAPGTLEELNRTFDRVEGR